MSLHYQRSIFFFSHYYSVTMTSSRVAVLSVLTTLSLTQSVSHSSNDQDRDYILTIWQDRELSWMDAETYCQDTYNSHLATVTTARDFHAAYNYSYWGGFVGLHDLDRDGQWSWMDDTHCETQNTNDSHLCSDFFVENIYHALNETRSRCSRIPIAGYLVTNFDCDALYRQFLCNKGMSSSDFSPTSVL